MGSVTLAPATVSCPAVNAWYVATAVVVPTFMEILNTTRARFRGHQAYLYSPCFRAYGVAKFNWLAISRTE